MPLCSTEVVVPLSYSVNAYEKKKNSVSSNALFGSEY